MCIWKAGANLAANSWVLALDIFRFRSSHRRKVKQTFPESNEGEKIFLSGQRMFRSENASFRCETALVIRIRAKFDGHMCA